MKWAKIGKKGTTKSSDEYASYEFYEDQKSLDAEFEIDRSTGQRVPSRRQSHLWVLHELKTYLKPDRQRDYELFCGGYIFYYDSITRNKATDHKIYFEWSQQNSSGPIYVAIYLSPKPYKVNKLSQIPKFSKTSANALEGINLGSATKTLALADTEVAMAAKDSSSDGLSIDPPPIPPPPPPPRE